VSIIAYARPLPGTDLADLDTADLAPYIGRAVIPTQRTAAEGQPVPLPGAVVPSQRAAFERDSLSLSTSGAALGARVFNLCHGRTAAGLPYPDLAEIADTFGVTEQTIEESIRAFFTAVGVDADGNLPGHRPVTAPVVMRPCPPWCTTTTHPTAPADADPTDLDDAFEYSRLHERFVTNVVAREAESARDEDLMHNAVELESFQSFDGSVDDPPSVLLALRPRGPRADTVRGEQSRLTPEQAEELGRALIEAARMARMGR
jgi:hypothetical protein